MSVFNLTLGQRTEFERNQRIMGTTGERIVNGLERFLDALKVGGELRTTIRADWMEYMERPLPKGPVAFRKTPRRIRNLKKPMRSKHRQ